MTLGSYAPTPVEAVIIGVIALGALAWLVLCDKLIGKDGGNSK